MKFDKFFKELKYSLECDLLISFKKTNLEWELRIIIYFWIFFTNFKEKKNNPPLASIYPTNNEKKGLNQFIPQHKEFFFLRNKKIRTKKINRIKRYTFKVFEHMY